MSDNVQTEAAPEENGCDAHHDENGYDPHFEPIISLPEVTLPTLEEEEVEMIKLRAKLFRYDSNESPPEWKERGTGDVKLLRHKEKNSVRVLMRRDKTLKICANHFVTPYMELKPNCGSDRAWVWSVIADFADETAKPELLAIRFGNPENAKKWKDAFEEAKQIVATKCKIYSEFQDDNTDDDSNSIEEYHDSSDESNSNESICNNALGKPEENEAAEALEKLNISDKKVNDNVGVNENDKILNTDIIVNKNNEDDLEKSTSSSKSIS